MAEPISEEAWRAARLRAMGLIASGGRRAVELSPPESPDRAARLTEIRRLLDRRL
jgi:hypothetical protein